MHYYKLNTLIDFILLFIAFILLESTFILGKQYMFSIILKITFFYVIFIQLINYLIKKSWHKKVI